MANTPVYVANMSARYQANIYGKTVALPFVNKNLEGDIEQGNTVKVKYFNNITLNTVGEAGENIEVSDWAEQSDDLEINQVRNKSIKIKDIEEVRSNADIQAKHVELISNASAKDQDSYALTTAVANAGVVINSGSPKAITKDNIYEEIEKMRVVLGENDLDEGQPLFLDYKRASALRQSDIYNNMPEGLTARQKASYKGFISGFHVFATNNIPTADGGANTYMVSFDENAVSGAEQFEKFKVTEGADAFTNKLLFENVYGMDVLGLNSARIVANKIVK